MKNRRPKAQVVSQVELNETGNKVESILLYILFSLFRFTFFFDIGICLSPLKFVIAMGLRYCFSHYYIESPIDEGIRHWLQNGTTGDAPFTIFNFCKCFFLFLPYCLFMIWWLITTALLFISAIYSAFGTRHMNDEGEFSELNKFGDYLNNKSRFKSYQSFLKFLQGKEE